MRVLKRELKAKLGPGFLTAGCLVGLLLIMPSVRAQSDSETAAILTRIAQTLNAPLPTTGDSGIRWDTVTADVKGRRLIYKYTFVDKAASDFNASQRENFVAATRSNIIKAQHPDSFWGFEHGCSQRFTYYDKNGAYLFEFSVKREDLK